MTFNKDSGLTKLWVDAVKSGKYSVDQVPNLFNLKEVVESVINGTAA